MRPIDADALIEVLKKSMAENPHKEEMQKAMHIHEHKYFLTLLTSFPTIQPEPHWIPVERELPEESGYYMTSNEYNGVTEDFYHDGHFWNADKNAYEVIAWMPLPEPFKSNNE